MKSVHIPTGFKIPKQYRHQFQLRSAHGELLAEIKTRNGKMLFAAPKTLFIASYEHNAGLNWIEECIARIRAELE